MSGADGSHGLSGPAEIDPRHGRVAPDVARELPGLELYWAALPGRDGGSPRVLAARLRQLADGFRGASVITMRTKRVPAAYRSSFRQLGLDPDVTRPPAEQAALSRLFHGTFRSQGRVADALLLALLETGVPVWALDGDRARGAELGIRIARPGERLGGTPATPDAAEVPDPISVSPGALVVADHRRPHAVLFGDPAPDSAVGAETRTLLLYAIGVAGVPAIHIEEAFWVAAEALATAD